MLATHTRPTKSFQFHYERRHGKTMVLYALLQMHLASRCWPRSFIFVVVNDKCRKIVRRWFEDTCNEEKITINWHNPWTAICTHSDAPQGPFILKITTYRAKNFNQANCENNILLLDDIDLVPPEMLLGIEQHFAIFSTSSKKRVCDVDPLSIIPYLYDQDITPHFALWLNQSLKREGSFFAKFMERYTKLWKYRLLIQIDETNLFTPDIAGALVNFVEEYTKMEIE